MSNQNNSSLTELVTPNLHSLCQNTLNVLVILTIFQSRGLMNSFQADEIMTEKTPYERHYNLYRWVLKKTDLKLEQFIQILMESGNETMANFLRQKWQHFDHQSEEEETCVCGKTKTEPIRGCTTSSTFTADGHLTGRVTASSLIVRKGPTTKSAMVGSLFSGDKVTILGWTVGTLVQGNDHWFKLDNGYVAAYYIKIVTASS